MPFISVQNFLRILLFIIITFSLQGSSAFLSLYFKTADTSTLFVKLTPCLIKIHAFELFFQATAISMVIIWVHVLSNSSLMHANLKGLCFMICFHIGTSMTMKIVIIVDNLTEHQILTPQTYYYLSTIQGISTIHFILDHAAIAIERTLATFKVANYEKAASENELLVLAFVKEIIAILSFQLLVSKPLIFGPCWVLLETVIGIIAIILYRVNLQNYKTTIGIKKLSTRYQTAENIRLLKPVLVYTLISFCYNIIQLCLLYTAIFRGFGGDYDSLILLEAIIHLIASIFSNVTPCCFLAYSSKVRKFFKDNMKSKRARNTSSVTPILTVTGNRLIMKNEQNVYFNQLEKAWK